MSSTFEEVESDEEILSSDDDGSVDVLDDEAEDLAAEEVDPVSTFLEEEDLEEDDDEEDNLDDLDEDADVINVSENHKFEIVSKNKTYERIESKKKDTQPIMSRFEFTKLIGIRAQQLACGMQPCVSFDTGITSTEFIAIQELLQKKMPLIVRRYLPNGLYEDWRVGELLVPDTILY